MVKLNEIIKNYNYFSPFSVVESDILFCIVNMPVTQKVDIKMHSRMMAEALSIPIPLNL